jgi:hypothetical protein
VTVKITSENAKGFAEHTEYLMHREIRYKENRYRGNAFRSSTGETFETLTRNNKIRYRKESMC